MHIKHPIQCLAHKCQGNFGTQLLSVASWIVCLGVAWAYGPLTMTYRWKKKKKKLFFSSFLYHLESGDFYLCVFLRCSPAWGFETLACQDLFSQSNSELLFAFNTYHPAFRKFLPGSREGVSSSAFFPKPRNGRILWECFVEYIYLAEGHEGGWKKEPVVLLPSFVYSVFSVED